jgi:beta-glucosidase
VEYNKEDFGEGFAWGVSTAAYQIEGGHNIDGKGPSIWDDFTKKKNKILGGHDGNSACNHYENYAQDIHLIHQLNIRNYRFSISWSRILPSGIGQVNLDGIDYYNKIIDLCLELGIVPWVTIYHWDLPSALQQLGGWTNRDIIRWFEFFTNCCVQHFGDRVRNWMILNEPMVFTGAGYFLGVHAPGVKGLGSFLSATHHATLCQAIGARLIKSIDNDFNVGTTFSYSHLEPYRPGNAQDIKATMKMDAVLNRLFIEPLLGLGYPKEVKIFQYIDRYMKEGDDKTMIYDMDFIGLQTYTRELIQYSPFMPFVGAKIIKASKRNVHQTLMDWEVHPPCIYEALKRYNTYGKLKNILVTENGAAFKDELNDTEINDLERVEFLKLYIGQVLKAKQEGVNVNGYFVWTLLDNFEWAEGYHPTFGLIHVDFKTQQRTIKNSGKWYKNFLAKSEV